MAQTHGKSDSSLIDRQLTISSVFAPYFGDNGYKFNNDGSIRVFSLDNGTLAGYNENSVVYSPVTLVGNSGNDYTLAYNQAMFARIQKTLEQDTLLLTWLLSGHVSKSRKCLYRLTTFTQSTRLWQLVSSVRMFVRCC